MSVQIANANAEAIEAWNTFLFDKFSRFKPLVTSGMAVHGEAALKRRPPQPGARVLDIGCGFGDTTIDIAQRVGPDGEAVGVDAAARFVSAAEEDARQTGTENARFFVADVESDPLQGPYDQAFSRFGVMFFANPVRALRNVRRSLKDGAWFTAAVWRRKDENAWVHEVERRVLEIVPHPEKQEGQITCGPGPFSMASPDVVSAQLKAAGFDRISFERFDADIRIGESVENAIELATALGPAGEVLRLAGEDAERKKALVTTALRDYFTSLARADGVYGGASSWLISARAA